MAHSWDPDRYLTYAEERGRPFIELLARIPVTDPRTVVDLGCGPGNLTAVLAERWPEARVVGVDSSSAMIERARREVPEVEFEVGDVRDWRGSADVLVSNATLQWLPEHLELLPRLLERVVPGGWLAFGVPGNFEQATHTLLRELAEQSPYAAHTAGAARPASHDPETYLDALTAAGAVDVDVWEATYLHVLTGPDPVFTWVSGTGARPVLQALPDGLRADFEAEYRRRLAEAYPPRPDARVVLPFRRIFAVARRGDR